MGPGCTGPALYPIRQHFRNLYCRDCIDILTQISATTSAMEGVALMLLDQHLEHCVVSVSDPEEAQIKLQEASKAIRRLVRS